MYFLQKTPSKIRHPQTTSENTTPNTTTVVPVGRSSEFGWLPWFFHASQRPHGDQGRTGTTGTSTQAGARVEGRWASAWWGWWWVRGEQQMTRWWQLKYFLFSTSIWGNDFQFDAYFSKGLKPPTRRKPLSISEFSLVKHEQMSNWLGVEHQPAIDCRWELFFFSGCKWVAWHFVFLVRLSDKWRGIHIICRDEIVES